MIEIVTVNSSLFLKWINQKEKGKPLPSFFKHLKAIPFLFIEKV